MACDLISVDDHIIEHARRLDDRLPATLREAGPHVEEATGGSTGSTRAPRHRRWA